MCRHLGYLGPAAAVGDVLHHGGHSLIVQSWAPNDMRCGAVANADGFGAAWWPESGSVGDPSEPVAATSYRSAAPIWTDRTVDDVLTHTRSTAVLAAVRSATVGMPVVATASAPFVDGRWAFSHNGVVAGWPHSLAGLAAEVPVEDLLRLPAATDSAGLWMVVRHLLRDHDPVEVLRRVVTVLDESGPGSRLNLLLGDGTTLWGTAVHHSLSTSVTDDDVWVASEPLDSDPHDGDRTWEPVPDRSLIVATAGSVTTHPL
ncbi:MAG: ergothioneine biosynthesis protein EgtC [Corynebacteriales bacterium]|uniref:Gamma-glutamyl-hercynylcysteine sulfoxide hydrolase n=1 Tax=Williamsia herbipolensis TaxID=1603258 RepID=A0AAU4JY05_9NOCA|nr:ergothioneine biosynthesis protein EgtC [Williamsia herbipolensis]MCX6470443.1 ergothioneine biosynthesis protein EgtC [Mycobacteriales bacterium]